MVKNAEFDENIKGRKTDATIGVLRGTIGANPTNILVVGCGSGAEAGLLARSFGSKTTGIDLGDEFDFNREASAPAVLMRMDARALEFPDDTFDLIYSFHALEHIPGPRQALSEMARVLRPGGHFLIGTPNKSRLVGYVGSARPLSQKIAFNLNDYRARLKGQWSNEAGAHAGFTARELTNLCHEAFGHATDVSEAYYGTLYRSRAKFLKFINMMRLRNMAFPCVYVGGRMLA